MESSLNILYVKNVKTLATSHYIKEENHPASLFFFFFCFFFPFLINTHHKYQATWSKNRTFSCHTLTFKSQTLFMLQAKLLSELLEEEDESDSSSSSSSGIEDWAPLEAKLFLLMPTPVVASCKPHNSSLQLHHTCLFSQPSTPPVITENIVLQTQAPLWQPRCNSHLVVGSLPATFTANSTTPSASMPFSCCPNHSPCFCQCLLGSHLATN